MRIAAMALLLIVYLPHLGCGDPVEPPEPRTYDDPADGYGPPDFDRYGKTGKAGSKGKKGGDAAATDQSCWTKTEIKVGQIVKAWAHPDSEKVCRRSGCGTGSLPWEQRC